MIINLLERLEGEIKEVVDFVGPLCRKGTWGQFKDCFDDADLELFNKKAGSLMKDLYIEYELNTL